MGVPRDKLHNCHDLTEQEKQALEAFVSNLYRPATSYRLELINTSAVDAACYRRLIFRASVPSSLPTLYRAPDGKHLVTGVMDLTVDPAVTQRKIRQDLHEQLSSGALLTSGTSTAPMKMVVFSDFQCPYCRRFASFLDELTPDERAKLQIIYRQLPLNMHAWAQDAAALSACVALQDKTAFWKLHDFLFSNQQEVSKDTLTAKALAFLSQEKAVDPTRVTSCLAEKSYQESLAARRTARDRTSESRARLPSS